MLNYNHMGVGQKIREFRRERDWSQDYLGELVGLTQTYISRIEKEEADPNSEQLRNFAKALGVTPAIFFEEPEKEYKARFLESIDDKNMRPVYANVPAGRGRMRETPATYEAAPPGVQDNGKGYWLRVKGDSMHPALRDGQLVLKVSKMRNVVVWTRCGHNPHHLI